MNQFKEAWLEEVMYYASGVLTRDDPDVTSSVTPSVQKMIGSRAMGTSASVAFTLALADGPLPIGDVIGASVLGVTGLYLYLTA